MACPNCASTNLSPHLSWEGHIFRDRGWLYCNNCGTTFGPEGEQAEAASAPTEVPVAAPGDDLLAGTVADVRAALATIDDLDELDRLAEAEQQGKGRAGVADAIEQRYLELEAEEADE